jgi:hypothetical protein
LKRVRQMHTGRHVLVAEVNDEHLTGPSAKTRKLV